MQANYLAEAIFEKAQALYSQKDYLESLKTLKDALTHIKVHQPPLEGRIYLLIAKCHFAMTQYREVRKICRQALDFSHSHQQIPLAVKIHQLSGQMECHQERYEDAISEYLKGLSLLSARPTLPEDLELKANLHLSVGFAALQIRAIKLQQKHFLQCLFIARRQKYPLFCAKALLGLGSSFFQQQKYPGARLILLKAVHQFYQLDDTSGIAQALLVLGQVYTKTYKYRRAVVTFKYAYNLFEKNSDQINQANSLVYLARIFLKVDIQLAKHLCDNVNELLVAQTSIHSKRQSEIILARNYVTMGMYYQRLEEIDLALNFLKEGMDIFETHLCRAEYLETKEHFHKLKYMDKTVKPLNINPLLDKLGVIY